MTPFPKKSVEMIPGIPHSMSDQILNLFRPLPKDTSLILFGSRAMGNYREGSDIDIAIQGTCITIKDRDTWLLKYETLNLPWKLDIVIYGHITESALIEHIDRVGIKIL